MVNLPKPRKVDNSKSLLKFSKKNAQKFKIDSNLDEILGTFLNRFQDRQFGENENQEISISIRQLLSSLQSHYNRDLNLVLFLLLF